MAIIRYQTAGRKREQTLTRAATAWTFKPPPVTSAYSYLDAETLQSLIGEQQNHHDTLIFPGQESPVSQWQCTCRKPYYLLVRDVEMRLRLLNSRFERKFVVPALLPQYMQLFEVRNLRKSYLQQDCC